MEQKTFNKAKILDERIIAIDKALQDIKTMTEQTMQRIILIGAFDDRAVRIELGEKQNTILADDIKDYIIRRLEKDALE